MGRHLRRGNILLSAHAIRNNTSIYRMASSGKKVLRGFSRSVFLDRGAVDDVGGEQRGTVVADGPKGGTGLQPRPNVADEKRSNPGKPGTTPIHKTVSKTQSKLCFGNYSITLLTFSYPASHADSEAERICSDTHNVVILGVCEPASAKLAKVNRTITSACTGTRVLITDCWGRLR